MQLMHEMDSQLLQFGNGGFLKVQVYYMVSVQKLFSPPRKSKDSLAGVRVIVGVLVLVQCSLVLVPLVADQQ